MHIKVTKVIQGLDLGEILERAVGGEPWAFLDRDKEIPDWFKPTDQSFNNFCDYLKHNTGHPVAIIDTTTPEIDWDKFDWDFFNQYGGLPVKYPASQKVHKKHPVQDNGKLRESPFYYWPRGEQPVPDNVEVEYIYMAGRGWGRSPNICRADDFNWNGENVISFKLTGRVL